MGTHGNSGNGAGPHRLIASNGFGMFMLGIALALGGAFASQSVAKAIVASRNSSSIRVKGSASVDLRADSARWSTVVTARGATLPAAYEALARDVRRVQDFLAKAGFGAEEAKPAAVGTSSVMRKDSKGKETTAVDTYILTQAVNVLTSKVDAVAAASRGVTELIRDGIDVSSGTPQYLVSNVEASKVDLLEQATRNAMARAGTLAAGSNSSVGTLLSASQGVIQITERGTMGSSDYGEYDTRTIEKTMRVVVSLEYAVR